MYDNQIKINEPHNILVNNDNLFVGHYDNGNCRIKIMNHDETIKNNMTGMVIFIFKEYCGYFLWKTGFEN